MKSRSERACLDSIAIIARDQHDPNGWTHERNYLTAVRHLVDYMGKDQATAWLRANVNPDWSWLRMARTVEAQVALYCTCEHDFHTEHGSDGSGEPDGDIELVVCYKCGLSASDDYLARWKEKREREARINAVLDARAGWR